MHQHADKKTLRRQRQKKIALGHKEDDHGRPNLAANDVNIFLWIEEKYLERVDGPLRMEVKGTKQDCGTLADQGGTR